MPLLRFAPLRCLVVAFTAEIARRRQARVGVVKAAGKRGRRPGEPPAVGHVVLKKLLQECNTRANSRKTNGWVKSLSIVYNSLGEIAEGASPHEASVMRSAHECFCNAAH